MKVEENKEKRERKDEEGDQKDKDREDKGAVVSCVSSSGLSNSHQPLWLFIFLAIDMFNDLPLPGKRYVQ